VSHDTIVARTVVIALLALLLAGQASAQTAPPAKDGSQIRVRLITFGPGTEIWERFGHNVIAITEPAHILKGGEPFDVSFHWGAFTFDGLNFYINYLQGHLDYWMVAGKTEPMIQDYIKANRDVWITELNLSPAQKLRMKRDLIRNLENPRYRYDYFRDNCSTRVRDAIDAAVDGQLKPQLAGRPTGTTFRWHMSRILTADPFMYVVLNYILGSPIDRPIDRWQECFLPELLMADLLPLEVKDEAGATVKLVASQKQEHAATVVRVGPTPPQWRIWFLLIGLACGSALAGLGEMLRRRRLRWGWVALAVVPWTAFVGLAGLIAIWAWFFTDHLATRANHNILHLGPLGVIVAWLSIGYLRRGRHERMILALAGAMVVLTVCDLPLKLLQAQVNGWLISWVLPMHMGLLAAFWRLRGRHPAGQIPKVGSVEQPRQSRRAR
jgi:hypothetical protein